VKLQAGVSREDYRIPVSNETVTVV
jgi:hypothetical protein